jgi:hypothetical protein
VGKDILLNEAAPGWLLQFGSLNAAQAIMLEKG